jgi:hypothetical protein
MKNDILNLKWQNRLARTLCGAGIVAGLFACSIPVRATTEYANNYTSLTNAIAAAASGDTIEITANITVDAQVVISGKGLTIEGLSTYTISVPVPGLNGSGVVNPNPSAFGVFNFNASGKTNTLYNLTIEGGDPQGSGGGILNTAGTLMLQFVAVTQSGGPNTTGGGLANMGGTVFMNGCNISRNGADYGGGFLNWSGTMFIEQCTISENRSMSYGGGGGGGENDATLYANNSTFANNVSTELGGALNNHGGTSYCVDCTFVGNIAYGNDQGGAVAHNGGTVTLVNSLFAYNYFNYYGTYVLNDIINYSGTPPVAYYCIFQSATNQLGSATMGTTLYPGDISGSDDSLFSGGANAMVLGPSGTQEGSGTIYQPFLYDVDSSQTPTAVLQPSSFAIGAGTQAAFSSATTPPVVAYSNVTSSTWQSLSGSSPATYVVTTDQNGADRESPFTVGAEIETETDLVMLQVNAATNGTVSGGTIYGDVYASGTTVSLTAIPNAGSTFTSWRYVLGGSGVASTNNPFNITLTSDVTLAPVFTAPVVVVPIITPELTLPSSITLAEDGSTNLDVTVTDSAVPIFTVITTATSSNTNLLNNSDLWFSGTGTNRVLSIRPGLHMSGTTIITVIASDPQPESITNSFTLNVISNNYPPMFLTSIADLTRNQNARPTNLSFTISDFEAAASHLTVTATSTNTILVPNSNLVLAGRGANRTLTLSQATNQNGTTLIQLVVSDINGTTATNDFTLTVRPVNQPPTFDMSTNCLVYDENFGPVTIPNFITNVTSGPPNQSSESTYWAFKYTTNFFAQAPSVDPYGTLTFQVATNKYGTNAIRFVLFNSGSTVNGGKNSLSNSVTLEVPWVNHVPSFTFATNYMTNNLVLVPEETLAVTNVGFLTNLTAGSPYQSNLTWAFTTTTVSTNTTNAAFLALSVATNGTLIIKPKAHSFGTNTVTVVMTDNGESIGAGTDSVTNTFQIGVVQIGHAPVIVGATNRTVLENGTDGLTAMIEVWDYDQSTNFVVTARSLSNNLATVTVTTNTIPAPGASNVYYTLTIALVTNVNGTAPIQFVASKGSLSTTNTFTLDILPVNHAPTFTVNTNDVTNNMVLVTEETVAVTNIGFLTNLSAGPPNEIKQSWTFAVTTVSSNTTNAAFTVLSAATNGTLIIKPKAHSFGTNTVTVVMTDSGGTANGGINAFTNTFQIGIVQIGHAPVIVGATNRTVLENATSGLTATIEVWDYDQTTNFVLTATSLSNNLATVTFTTNTIPAAGTSNVFYTLTLALVTNVNGTAPIRVVASEGSLSTTNTFTLDILLVNHAPTFTVNTNYATNNLVLVAEETAAVTNVGFLTNLSAGPPNEIAQTWSFTVTSVTGNPTNAAFTALSVATNGTLTIKPKAHSFGTNTVTVVMTDNGGTANGGTNAYTNTFQIGVVQTSHAPVIVGATNRTVLENATSGLTATINVWDYDQKTNFILTATSLSNNLATVTFTTNSAGTSNVVYTLTFALVTNTSGTAPIQLVASEGSLSTTNTFTLDIVPVNHAPTFTVNTNYATNNLVLVPEETAAVTNVGFLTNLTAGPPNEITQSWTFTITPATGNPTNAVFKVLSAATNGTLIIQPQAHSFGTNTVTVVMTDNGGTANGGADAFTNTFQIGVVQTNHAPVIVGATNRTVLENATSGLTATINVWDYDQKTNFIFTATSLSNSLATVTFTTNSAGTSNVVYALTFALVTNTSGNAPIQLVASEGSLSTTNTFTLDILLVNHAPTFTVNTNDATNNLVLVAEETAAVTNIGFLTNLSAGPPNEITQSWTFTVTPATGNPTNAIFKVLSAATNGTLIIQPQAHSFGTNTVTVVMTDNGGTANGGIDAFTNTFQIGVVQTNHAPVIAGATNRTVLENASTGLTAAIEVWDYDQTTNFVVTATSLSNNLATVTITTNTTPAPGTSNVYYTLTFAPVANASGLAPIQVIASEGSLSTTNTFTLDILWVNQAPSFDLAVSSVTVDKYNAPTVISNVVTSILAGPPNESAQTVSFIVTNGSASSFLVQPSVNSNGTLAFTPGTTGGTVTVGIEAKDNGGTANGGVDISAFQTLTITIPTNVFQALAGPFAGLFYNTNTAANASSGYFSLVLSNSGAFNGYLLRAGASNTFNGQFSISNATATVTTSNNVLDLTIDTTANWTETISGSVSNTVAGWNAELLSYLAGYCATNLTPLAGGYLMVMPNSNGLSSAPAGDSIFSFVISNTGVVSMFGNTADDTSFSQVSQISSNGYYPLYVPLYGSDKGSLGSLIGWLDFTEGTSNNVTTNSSLTWFNEPGASTLYPAGFTIQAAPVASLYNPNQFPILSFNSGSVILSGGGLTTPITNTVLTVDNNFEVVSGDNQLSLTMEASSGEIVGSFVDPNNHTNFIESVILQDTNICGGYFYGTNNAGSTTRVGSFILTGSSPE